jgi:glycogen debranching enzyme
MSYHNGSVWPHDNALIGLGFSLYGMKEQTCKILHGLFEASRYVELRRMPELFCGFHKRPDGSGPTLYPVACAPQAWSAGSVFLLLKAALGLEVRALERQIYFSKPHLPLNLDEVIIENLRIGDASADLLIRREGSSVDVKLLRQRGDIEVLKRS